MEFFDHYMVGYDDGTQEESMSYQDLIDEAQAAFKAANESARSFDGMAEIYELAARHYVHTLTLSPDELISRAACYRDLADRERQTAHKYQQALTLYEAGQKLINDASHVA